MRSQDQEEILRKSVLFAGLFVEAVCIFRDKPIKKWATVPKFAECLELPLLDNFNIAPSRLSNISAPFANYCVTEESLVFFHEA